MVKCDRCSNRAVITLRYGNHNFCRNHFNYSFEKRFLKAVRENRLVEKGDNVLIAVSGGKDSLTLAHMMARLSEKLPIELEALTVNEGIEAHRAPALKYAEEECGKLGLKLNVVELKEEKGVTIDEIAGRLESEGRIERICMHCGVTRRDILNKYALEHGFDSIATGHNLDDEVESIVMNFFDNDLQRMARIGPSTGVLSHEKFVKKIKPLTLIPVREIAAYALMNNISSDFVECPYRGNSKRFYYRRILNELEERFPGTKHSIYRSFSEVSPLLRERFKGAELSECRKCGMPSSTGLCRSCSIREEFEGKEGFEGPVV